MINLNLKKSSVKQILEYLFILFTILYVSVYFYQLEIPIIKHVIDLGWQLSLFLLCINAWKRNNREDNEYLILFICAFLFISGCLFIGYYLYYPFSFHYIMSFVIDPIFIIIYFYCNSNKKLDLSLFYEFEHIMVILAVISLIFYVFYYIGIKPNTNFITNWGGTDAQHVSTSYPGYFYISFVPATNYTFMGLKTLRNTGIFIEAPKYSYALYVALLINLFLSKRANKKFFNWELIILIITIFSTLSTTGMILSMISIFVFVLLRYKNILTKIIFLISLPFLIYLIKTLFVQKKYISSEAIYQLVNSSYYVRHDDMIASIHAWGDHLLIGNGISNTSIIYKYINPLRILENGDLGITADLFEVLAFGGIILSLFYIIPTILSFWVSTDIFYFAILNFVVFMVESVMLDKMYIIILSFLVAGYLWKRNRELIKS